MMNVLLLASLALPAGLPGTPDPADTSAEWNGLDQEISNLASTLSAAEGGVNVSGFLRARLEHSSDDAFSPGPPADLSGFDVTNARLAFTGTVGDYSFKVQPEFASSTLLKDAKVSWNCGEQLKVTLGNYKTPFSPRFMNSEQKQAFLDRTLTATDATLKPIFFDRDVGVMLSGSVDVFSWMASVQNGEDDVADEYLITGRVEVDLIGDTLGYEGGYGLGDEQGLTLGLAWADDGSVMDNDALTVDAKFEANPFTAGLAFFDMGTGVGDNSPYDVYATWMLTPDEWEVAVRYEDLDDTADTTAITAGVNWYLYGTDSKWQLNWRNQDSDSATLDGSIIQAGLTLAF